MSPKRYCGSNNLRPAGPMLICAQCGHRVEKAIVEATLGRKGYAAFLASLALPETDPKP